MKLSDLSAVGIASSNLTTAKKKLVAAEDATVVSIPSRGGSTHHIEIGSEVRDALVNQLKLDVDTHRAALTKLGVEDDIPAESSGKCRRALRFMKVVEDAEDADFDY